MLLSLFSASAYAFASASFLNAQSIKVYIIIFIVYIIILFIIIIFSAIPVRIYIIIPVFILIYSVIFSSLCRAERLMHKNAGNKIRALVIRFKLRQRRTVGVNSIQNFLEARVPALSKMQLF